MIERNMPVPTAISARARAKAGNPLSGAEDKDNNIGPICFFVPGENINTAVLVEYISRHVDRTAKITSAQHPAVC